MKAEEAMQTISEALKEMEPFLVPEYIANTLAALDSLVANSKDLELEIQTLVQENFWELAGKPAVEPNEDVEGVVRDISTLCHTKAAAYFDWDMCSRIITARDERIRRESADRVIEWVVEHYGAGDADHDTDFLRAAIMGGKE